MKYTRWTSGGRDEAALERLREAGYPRLLSAVLASRGVGTPEEAALFLAGERIAVYGDYDVDGITATVLLVDYLRSRGAACEKYIPRRVEDGYGLGREPLRTLRERGVSLVITVDCGITGVEEARYAREIGLDLVITDHHEC